MPTFGPPTAEIAIIGDYPDNSGHGFPRAGEILTRLGIVTSSCFCATLTEIAPPLDKKTGQPDIDQWLVERKTCPGEGWVHWEGFWVHPTLYNGFAALREKLHEVQPKLVILLGKAPLAMFCGQTAIAKWRGSRLTPAKYPFTCLPTIHPRSLIKQPDQLFILQMDLKRAYNIYTHVQLPRLYSFLIEPTFDQVIETLTNLLQRADEAAAKSEILRLSGDLETRAANIACFGIAWSETEAICIPHLVIHPDNPFYWSEDEEAQIVWLYHRLFEHKAILWIGQNYSYDCQYYYRHWGAIPHAVRDTMIGHHSLHSNIRKGLDFLSSMYARDHIYWKGEISEWKPSEGERQFWTYNLKDCCITYEIDTEILKDAADRNTEHFTFQQSLFFPVLRMMNRGIRLDVNQRSELKKQLTLASIDRQTLLNEIVGHELNPRSSTQLKKFFYDDLGIPGIQALGSESLTTNSPTLAIIAEREPLLKPLCQLIVELRSIGVFLGTFIDASLDSDGRMRCSFSIAGPTTYRFSSSENAFGSGMNLQNIPVAEKQKIKDKNYIKLPNIRKLFIPDEGYTFFDADLDRADMQVVGWESGDEHLKKALKLGVDLHCMSAAEIYGIKGIPVEELIETHPNYPEHRARIGKPNRDRMKNGGHACDYGVGDRKLAQTLAISVHEAGVFKSKWFGLYPGIRKWQIRVETDLARQGYVENKFGARLYVFGRVNLPEYLGWIPQSTVAGVINRALINIDAAYQRGETTTQLLIQVHDSLAGQFKTSRMTEECDNIRRLGRVVVPYDDPLIIPVGIKTSTKSWGDCL